MRRDGKEMDKGKEKEKGERLLGRFEIGCRESAYRDEGCRKLVRELVGIRMEAEEWDEEWDEEDVDVDIAVYYRELGIDFWTFSGTTASNFYGVDY